LKLLHYTLVFYKIIIMNFKSIFEIFKRAPLTSNKMQLGRWNIHNYRETSLKIKYATEDNCGISSHTYKNTRPIPIPIQHP
jgi:hypothetical protein